MQTDNRTQLPASDLTLRHSDHHHPHHHHHQQQKHISNFSHFLSSHELPDSSHVDGDANAWIYAMLQQIQGEKDFNFHPVTEALLILSYTLFIAFGSLGNGLVCYVVARNPHMRTPRNIFIINLAISDLTLCVFTQPLNLYLLLRTQWELGSFMCKLVTMFQGTNVFVSTISITAIALDRFQVRRSGMRE